MNQNLHQPRALSKDTLRITPLGGLGDVGRNMTSFESNGKILLIDCGVLFPDEDQPGVDLILPSLHLIEERLGDVVALLVTHGHEDHIGAIPYLLRRRADIPIYASQLTCALIKGKLNQHQLGKANLNIVSEGERIQVADFEAEFLAVNHSIPDALAIYLKTPGGTVLHTGDFKMDQLPLDNRLTDLNGFARIGDAGLDLFMCDSTNAETPGFTAHERDIEPAMERVFASARQKLIVACFASHVHRVQQVLNAAARHNRKAVFVGRSMVRNMAIAEELGYLDVPKNSLVDMKNIDDYPDDKLVIVSTGSQGEPLSALSRIANLEHPVIEAGQGDVVLLASSLIPGNENSVYRVINRLTRNGVTVVHKANALVHVSGHASAGELLYCYNILKPKNALPVHGEVRHLVANAKLAVATGVPEEQALIAEDGAVVDLRDGVAKIVGQLDAGYIFVDGQSVGEIGDDTLNERNILGEEGFISIVAVVNLRSKKVVSEPYFHARGFAEDDDIFDEIRGTLSGALCQALQGGATDTYELQQLLRRQVGQWVSKRHHRRPMILPIVIAA
ncbi:MAG: ribonuclease J [Propionibacteriaceae bacterium]|jgi:ribonuclease J|nr:ribonuclease J [Propionibacteriaceae bacterium]